jgi:uncharacterized membrane protein YGL010W
MKIRIRPAILLGEAVLAALGVVALVYGHVEVATAAVTGIAATIHKLVESEEKHD